MPEVKDMGVGIQCGFTISMGDASEALHNVQNNLPWLESEYGQSVRLFRFCLNLGLWVVETLWPAGYKVQTHYQIGPLFMATPGGGY